MNRFVPLGAGALTLLLFSWAASPAQEKPQQPPRDPFQERGISFGRTATLLPRSTLRALELTEAQQEQMEKLQQEMDAKLQEGQTKIMKIMEEARTNQDAQARQKVLDLLRANREETNKIRDEYLAKFRTSLTEKQQAELDNRANRNPFRGFGPREDSPFARLLPLNSDLTTPAVQARLELTAEQKEKLAQLKKEFEEKAAGVLTEEQKKKYDEIRTQQRRGGFAGPGTDRPNP